MKKAVPATGVPIAPSSISLAGGLMPAAEERVRRAADAQVLLRRQIHHLARLGDVDAERLLGMDMLAGAQHREADVGVGERHRQVDHDLDVVALEQLVDPHRRHAERGALLLRRRAAHVGDRAQLEIGEALRGLEIGRADDAAADDAETNFPHEVLRVCALLCQPLTAPAVRPATMCFCASRNSRIVGRMVSVMNARIRCHSDEYSP